jgi:hypothetical protein
MWRRFPFRSPDLNRTETLHWVRDILDKGAAWFTWHGRRAARACAASRSLVESTSRA